MLRTPCWEGWKTGNQLSDERFQDSINFGNLLKCFQKFFAPRMEYRQWIAGSLLVPGIKNLEAATTTKTHWFLLKIPRALTTKSGVDKWVCVCMCVLCAHAHAHRPTYTPTCIRVVAVGRVGGRRSGKKGGWSRGQCCHGWGRERCQIPLVPRRTWMVRFDHPLPHAIS